MDLKELKRKLELMGYKNIYSWCDPPGAYYDWHTHSRDEVRLVYKGSMVIGTEEGVYHLKEGDIFEVKAGQRHWARTEEGVCYLCGEK
ncbi:cupin domain-containing protein [Thermocrinis minervae]|uniref:Cupin domain-containing protein n=1 Tax=Thermocrinis minervae TaxID=381751 RepID=A0A1M6TCQ5_9AQUI|nr:cupin domain-containing protein [Thermocrinis minervae]SHK54787.1 Cupin domain-containing protein [Thermocrinis minervae]